MGERKRKEIQEYKVDEKTRTVKAYVKTLSDTAEKTIELYKKMGYTVIMLDKEKPKPRTKQRIGTKEMKLYLKGKIDDKIYKKMVEKIDNKEKFFEIKSWLKEELHPATTWCLTTICNGIWCPLPVCLKTATVYLCIINK